MIDVVAAIIMHEGKILVAQRGPSQSLAGKWEFPGGKIEPGETRKECLIREIREELSIDIAVDCYFNDSFYDPGQVRLLGYICRWISGTIELKEHAEIRWITVTELLQYDFAPADRDLVKKLKEVWS